mmetsp:Transcript_13911/g.28586  ORF Transcript_13911/g.28586 Transcript_13911/m.28586 type:complete len:128 (-) Transcript_13911:1344-1727(-)
MQPYADHPPLDPPPFGHASVRQCIPRPVHIQNRHDIGRLEVLILTSITRSVEELLREDDGSNGDYMSTDEVEISDFTDSSSSSEESSSEDDDVEGDGVDCVDRESRSVPDVRAFWLSRNPIREVGYH